MTAADFDLVTHSLAAERAGDAARALELHTSVPALNLRSRHNVLLAQLAALGDELPDLGVGTLDRLSGHPMLGPRTETGRFQRRALKHAIETFHDDQLADCHANRGDPVKVMAWVASESWLFHQFLLHDMCGLERFVDELATVLAEHAGLLPSWAGAPLGGYLVGPSLPGGRLCVEDLAADSWTEVLDLGARAERRWWRLGPRATRAQRHR